MRCGPFCGPNCSGYEIGPKTAQGGITERIAPVDEGTLLGIIEWAQTGPDPCQWSDESLIAWQSVGNGISVNIGVDAPIGSVSFLPLIVIDEGELAQSACLVGGDVERSQRLPDPIGLSPFDKGEWRSRITCKHSATAIPDRLKPEIVVDPAVGQPKDLGISGLSWKREPSTASNRPGSSSTTGERKGGKALEAAIAVASGIVGDLTRPTR